MALAAFDFEPIPPGAAEVVGDAAQLLRELIELGKFSRNVQPAAENEAGEMVDQCAFAHRPIFVSSEPPLQRFVGPSRGSDRMHTFEDVRRTKFINDRLSWSPGIYADFRVKKVQAIRKLCDPGFDLRIRGPQGQTL